MFAQFQTGASEAASVSVLIASIKIPVAGDFRLPILPSRPDPSRVVGRIDHPALFHEAWDRVRADAGIEKVSSRSPTEWMRSMAWSPA